VSFTNLSSEDLRQEARSYKNELLQTMFPRVRSEGRLRSRRLRRFRAVITFVAWASEPRSLRAQCWGASLP
jgi:hypothetical protein